MNVNSQNQDVEEEENLRWILSLLFSSSNFAVSLLERVLLFRCSVEYFSMANLNCFHEEI